MVTVELNATFIVFLLQDPDYFNMTATEAGEVYGDILFYTHLAITIFCDIPVGFAVELFGRKFSIFGGVMLSVVSFFFMQYIKILPLIYLIRFSLSLAIVPALVSPLVTDYCHHNKRGLAFGYSMILGTIGLAINAKLLPFFYNNYGASKTWIGITSHFLNKIKLKCLAN